MTTDWDYVTEDSLSAWVTGLAKPGKPEMQSTVASAVEADDD